MLEDIKQFFVQYATSFRKSDPVYNDHIKLKQHHTARVVKEISLLASLMGFNDEQIAFVEALAWLHDIGRFEQYDIYATFSDAESENHAEMALRVIDNNRMLDKFSDEQAHILRRAILNHNLKQIPRGETEMADFYSRLLRDADKLDIWRVSLEINIFHKIKSETFPDSYAVPGKLLGYFIEQQTIPLQEVDSFYDSILFRLSWVFDLNFNCTLEQFKARDLLHKFLKKLPNSEDLDKIETSVMAYIGEKLQAGNTAGSTSCLYT